MVVPLSQELPAGEYSTWLGLYESASAGDARVPAAAADGRTVAHEMVELRRVTVVAGSN
jgi:hypothetical protein